MRVQSIYQANTLFLPMVKYMVLDSGFSTLLLWITFYDSLQYFVPWQCSTRICKILNNIFVFVIQVRINQRFHENVCMRQSSMTSIAISNIRKDLLGQPLQLLSGVWHIGSHLTIWVRVLLLINGQEVHPKPTEIGFHKTLFKSLCRSKLEGSYV